MNSNFIWPDPDNKKRNLHALFRYNFEIDSAAKSAEFKIFADSYYNLYLNGKFVNFGPVRFDPKYPLYDTYKLKKLLLKGKNTIAVIVNYYGCKTYKTMPAAAALLTDGCIETEKGLKINLSSSSENWKCRKYDAYDSTAPKLSFPLNPLEIFHQSKDIPAWNQTNFDDSEWKKPVSVPNCGKWGKLKPRNIPFMSGKAVKIKEVLHIAKLSEEKVFSFRVASTFFFEDEHDFSGFLAFATYIFSPSEQSVKTGLFWGEHWLNGKFLENYTEDGNAELRRNYVFDLKKGWNYFFGKVKIYSDEFAFYMAFPENSDIEISAEKKRKSRFLFKHTEPVSRKLYDKFIKNKKLPFNENDELENIGGWKFSDKNDKAQNPGRETDWKIYSELHKSNLKNLNSAKFAKEQFPQGFAVELDLGFTQLVIPEIVISGVKNALVDFAYSEQVNKKSGTVSLYHSHAYHAADRAVCSENTLHWRLLHPRGIRYMIITVRNPENDVRIEKLNFHSANYPVKNIGKFKCSDEKLNEIWRMCRRTQAIDMEDAYIDCPTRERGMYGRDTLIQYVNNLAFFGDNKLMHRCLQLYAQSTTDEGLFRAVYPNTGNYFIADFALNMLEGFYDYWKNSGDISLIADSWNALKNNLKWFTELSDMRKDGLLIADWPGKLGIESHYASFHGDGALPPEKMCQNGPSCYMTCTYLLALKSAAKLAKIAGDSQKSAEFAERHEKTAKFAVEKFWDDEKKCFADDLEHRKHPVTGNIWAVRSGILDKDKKKHIGDYFKNKFPGVFKNGKNPDNGVLVSPHFAYYLFDALYSLNLPDIAEREMKRGWGYMLKKGCRTCMEYYSRYHDSHSHAWSASPGYYLSRNILGVHFPSAPNKKIVEIDIKASANITSAEGSFPHPDGEIYIKWYSKNRQRKIEASGPEGVEINIKNSG